jgi:hypothetical protein
MYIIDRGIIMNFDPNKPKSVSRSSQPHKFFERFLDNNLTVISAELQDSYSTLMGHKRSRYEGTKLTSLKYNTYSSQSSAWAGDVSYGKTAAIDNYSNQMGIFTQIKDNDFLVSPQKNNVAIKYLVDVNGNLTELNERNKYWVDVQNMFKTGTKGIVSLFDSQKFANQKVVNGSKLIYSSGYDYSPIVYNSTNERLYFKFTPDTSFGVKQFKITTNKSINNQLIFCDYETVKNKYNITDYISLLEEKYTVNMFKLIESKSLATFYELFNKIKFDSNVFNIDITII